MTNKLTFKEFLNIHKEDTLEEIQAKYLEEAGMISSTLAIKKQNDAIRHGKNVLRAKSVEDKLDSLARQGVAIASLATMAVASSGEDSAMSKVATAVSIRKI